MGVDCGSQVTLCEYPIRLDTYRGCSHGCRYCFAQMKTDISVVKPENCLEAVKSFVAGKRTAVTRWCDWDIPLHWGGMSDPFQPAERELGVSLRVLRFLAESGYPFIVSTKGSLITEEPYISLVEQANAVVQVSMACSAYDAIEPGAPCFEERVEMLRRLKGKANKVVARIQPFIVECGREIASNIPVIAQAGADAVTVEGMKFKKKKPGLVRVGGDWCYPESKLKLAYQRVQAECQKARIGFFCAENRLRKMGDGTACCGCGELPGFAGNKFNVVSMRCGEEAEPTAAMMREGSAACFKSLYQNTGTSAVLRRKSFYEMIGIEARKGL